VVSGEEEEGEIDHFLGARDGDSFSPKAAEPMALTTVILLDSDSQRLAGDKFFGRQNFGVGGEIIGAEKLHVPMCNPRVKSLQRARTSIATFPFKQLSGNRIQHFPEPEFLRFFCK